MMNISRCYLFAFVLLMMIVASTRGETPVGTAFTYQGRLLQDGQPVDGPFSLTFSLYDVAEGGTPLATMEPVVVEVSNGLFVVVIDFGEGLFKTDARWLEITVNDDPPVTLSPRQRLTANPVAISLPGLWTEQREQSPNVIGGHKGNLVNPDAVGAAIGGGGESGYTNSVTGSFGTVSGGRGNAASLFSVVGGGINNSADGERSFVGGGTSNIADGYGASVVGGDSNTASGNGATVSGGEWNQATGYAATVMGGTDNVASGKKSLAAGNRARAMHEGSFVWGDSYGDDVESGAEDEWTVRASGGVRFYSDKDLSAGVHLPPGGGAWQSVSDRAAKENFEAVDTIEILQHLMQIPIESWNYRSQDPTIRHIGPVAQDFYDAFGAGEDNRHITTIDADGIALAAIQGLHEIVQQKDQELMDLRRRLDALEAAIASLVQREKEEIE
jgi:hypothetical protein